ncbi:MAG: DASS family sodium-coupled anion symporter [Candidatus Bipolaricaulota bacterium]|nr:DASS family sodium-coupled anion symporter [Candidatus Bipolaricaulota bacterium]
MKELRKWLQSRWTWFLLTTLLVILILSIPTPEGLPAEGHRALALLAAVVILFIAEPISAPGTILFIAVYQVVMGLGTPNEVARSFMHDAVFFIMGALMIGVALTSQDVGQRLILFLINKLGSSAKRISFALVSSCALLAGFIAGHVVAAVMTPMVLSLVQTMKESTDESVAGLSKFLLFSVAYGASIGALYAPSGGGRNIIILSFLERMHGINIGYGQWIIYSLPITLLLIPVTSWILYRTFQPSITDLSEATAGLRAELEEREMTGETGLTIAIFVMIVVLWITMGRTIGLGIIALIGAISYLVFGIVKWEDYHTNINWGVILIYMGALSLGSVLESTQAAEWIANMVLSFVRNGLGLSGLVPISLTSSILSIIMTNLMSAGATASVVGPITLQLAELASINPLFMGLLTAISTSLGFLLLLATPANAIIYSTGHVKPKDFLVAGVWLTLASFLILFLVVFTWWALLGLI